jgi:hypothetical protein
MQPCHGQAAAGAPPPSSRTADLAHHRSPCCLGWLALGSRPPAQRCLLRVFHCGSVAQSESMARDVDVSYKLLIYKESLGPSRTSTKNG